MVTECMSVQAAKPSRLSHAASASDGGIASRGRVSPSVRDREGGSWERGFLQKREGVPEMGTNLLKALKGYRASNRGSKGSRKTPEALRG